MSIWHLFCDESGISGKPFYAFGALWIKENNIERFEKEIERIRKKHSCTDEIKWQSANSKRYADFYNELVKFFFSLIISFLIVLLFNCLLLINPFTMGIMRQQNKSILMS